MIDLVMLKLLGNAEHDLEPTENDHWRRLKKANEELTLTAT